MYRSQNVKNTAEDQVSSSVIKCHQVALGTLVALGTQGTLVALVALVRGS